MSLDVRCLHLVVVANAGAFTCSDGDVDDEVVVEAIDVDGEIVVIAVPFSSPPWPPDLSIALSVSASSRQMWRAHSSFFATPLKAFPEKRGGK